MDEGPNEPGVAEPAPGRSSNTTTDVQQEGGSGGGASSSSDPSAYFNAQQPKHVGDGLTDGLKNLATGVVLGAACFVAAPIAGLQRDGYLGAAKGVLSGTCGLLGMTAIGALTAARQIVRGVVNTKSALESVAEGRVWHDGSREWIAVHLPDMLRDVPAVDDDLLQAAAALQATAAAAASSAAGPSPASAFARAFAPTAPNADAAAAPDRALYAELGVPPTATPAEIKKAYVARALKLHPDKNTHDPNATKKFQDLSDAYRVLSNPASRAQYDATGSQTDAAAPDALYEALEQQLGCRAFLPFVGKLKWLIIMASPLRHSTAELQRRRLVRVAVELARILDDDDIDSASYRPRFSRVVQLLPEMLTSKLGPPLVRVIGTAYADASRQLGEHLAVGICDNLVVDTVSTLGGYANTAAHAASTAYRSAVHKAVAEDDMVELIRRISKNDVYDTVSKACEFVCRDLAVDESGRQRRIIRLGFLGQLFVESADSATPPPPPPLDAPSSA